RRDGPTTTATSIGRRRYTNSRSAARGARRRWADIAPSAPAFARANRSDLLLPCTPPVKTEPPSSSGLGRRPFTAVTGIRTPLGVRMSQGPVLQFGVHAALSRRRPRVQIPSGPLEIRTGCEARADQ